MKSIHDVRFYNFALLDILGTIFIAWLSHRYFGYSLASQVVFFTILAIVIHCILEINTTLNYYLGISDAPDAFVKDPPMFWINKKVKK